MTTRHREPDPGQTDLFGDPTPAPAPTSRPVSRVESNDIDLMLTVAANAVRCGYLLVGNAERVYARSDTTGDQVQRVPHYEDDAVHQLLRRRWLTLGATHHVRCGAASLTGTAVLVPKDTRSRIDRWEHLQRPPSWPSTHTTDPAAPDGPGRGRVIPLNPRRHP